ncbi:MAG: NUDIX domain-containing protein [Pyrinomonadaceae bacterium]|nr:NUDIX domain-containing protein [Phycisphaerales bacterium]
MRHIRTSARAIIRSEDAMLVVRYRDDRGNFYALPGGGQRPGEELSSAVVREVAEETGLQVHVGPLRFVRECLAGPGSRALPADFHQVEFYFTCEILGQTPMAPALDPGQDGVEWCTVAQLRDRCFFPMALLDAISDDQKFGYLGVV